MKRLVPVILMLLYTGSYAQKADIVFTKAKYDNYSAAKSHSVNEIKDGDPLWMYVKFDKPVKNYAVFNEYAHDGKPYSLTLGVGPKNDENREFYKEEIGFSETDLSKNEIELNLAPGSFGKDKASRIILNTVAGSRAAAGVWENALRIYSYTKGEKKVYGSEPITFNVPDGTRIYTKNNEYFPYILEKERVPANQMGGKGYFAEAAVIDAMKKAIKAKGINFSNFKIGTNSWNEKGNKRHVYGNFFYNKDGKCYFGIVYADQKKSGSSWGPTTTFVDPTSYPVECN